jgi:hypothetical protein
MIIPAIYNKFKMFGSDDWDLYLLWRFVNDDGTPGSIINLTDWNARLRMYPDKYADRNIPIVELTKDAGITLSDGASGANIYCNIPDEDSDFDLNPPGYLILEVENPDGNQWERLLEGKLKYSMSSILEPVP